jgi:hypothetical protein
MKMAVQVFSDAGFPDSAVKVGVRERKAGIAPDIRAESHPGYACVILGRKRQESYGTISSTQE